MEHSVDWSGWEDAGKPLPGAAAHRPMMPYARSSAAEARAKGNAGVDFREAAVFIGIEPDGTMALIERTPEKGPHGGQMAWPGGAREPGESMLECALREWREELGLPGAHGPMRPPVPLTEVHVEPSRFVVRPFVAPVELPDLLMPDEVEVAAVHRIRLDDILDDRYRTRRPVLVHLPGRRGFKWEAPGFALPEVPFIWGATALILCEVAEWYAAWSNKPSPK